MRHIRPWQFIDDDLVNPVLGNRKPEVQRIRGNTSMLLRGQ